MAPSLATEARASRYPAIAVHATNPSAIIPIPTPAIIRLSRPRRAFGEKPDSHERTRPSRRSWRTGEVCAGAVRLSARYGSVSDVAIQSKVRAESMQVASQESRTVKLVTSWLREVTIDFRETIACREHPARRLMWAVSACVATPETVRTGTTSNFQPHQSPANPAGATWGACESTPAGTVIPPTEMCSSPCRYTGRTEQFGTAKLCTNW